MIVKKKRNAARRRIQIIEQAESRGSVLAMIALQRGQE